ncbi:MAG: sigma-70 family RNA polymerase sigma factor [Candidatus Korobacteraceae bacterium]
MDNFVTARFPLPLSKEQRLGVAVAADQMRSPTETSDEVLIERVCDGDKEALAYLFRRHARIVRGVAYRVLRDSSEADDLLQDIFLLIHRLCRTFDSSKGPARFWILQMTYRRAISRRRYLTSRHFYTRLDLDDASEKIGDGRSQLAPKDHPIERMIGQEALQRTFKELSEDQQKTLRLFFFEGYTFEEIAVKLGQTTGNVSHHYYRGLEKLRRQMQILGGKLQARRGL